MTIRRFTEKKSSKFYDKIFIICYINDSQISFDINLLSNHHISDFAL